MGPLQGFHIVEIAGIGPTQFCGMLLADMGASVIRLERPGGADVGVGLPAKFNLMNRSRPAITVDLKSSAGVELVLKLCDKADALFEGFRPGVMERLGLGPDVCMNRNKRLVYGRMTGWGQDGPLAGSVGHDGNYAALSGALHAIGEKNGRPTMPLNLVADFGGGGAFLAMGILAALLETSRSNEGQVVDAAMVDGAASLMTLFYGMHAAGLWRDQRCSNMLDGAAPFYRTYETSDGKSVVVCAIEAKFYKVFLQTLEIEDVALEEQFVHDKWPALCQRLEKVFIARSRDEWCELFAGKEACVDPVMSLAETPGHEHNKARETFVDIDGIVQPAPAPRFSRTKSSIGQAAAAADADPAEILQAWGL